MRVGMSKSKKPAKSEPKVRVVNPAGSMQGKLKSIGGSQFDDWNNILANQTIQTLWVFKNSDEQQVIKQQNAAIAALAGIGPKDEIEGMIAAQLVACHNATMECHRRAMHPEQTFEGRRENLSQANKLSRTYATLLESLNRHRGKGQQKVTVEHVHVHEGGQAIVGNVETPGGGFTPKSKDQPHALAYAPGATMRSPDTTRESVPVASDAERPVPDARRNVTGRTEGQ
jgi:hypothetical protein